VKHRLWLLLASSIAGLITAAVAVLDEADGIAYSAGAYLVLVSTALLVLAALALTFFNNKWKWLTLSLIILSVFDLIGTAIAAYFLETAFLLAFMALGLIGCLVYLLVAPANQSSLRYDAARRVTR
jgi:hypothetical protein